VPQYKDCTSQRKVGVERVVNGRASVGKRAGVYGSVSGKNKGHHAAGSVKILGERCQVELKNPLAAS